MTMMDSLEGYIEKNPRETMLAAISLIWHLNPSGAEKMMRSPAMSAILGEMMGKDFEWKASDAQDQLHIFLLNVAGKIVTDQISPPSSPSQ